jgi:hypothetical protein
VCARGIIVRCYFPTLINCNLSMSLSPSIHLRTAAPSRVARFTLSKRREGMKEGREEGRGRKEGKGRKEDGSRKEETEGKKKWGTPVEAHDFPTCPHKTDAAAWFCWLAVSRRVKMIDKDKNWTTGASRQTWPVFFSKSYPPSQPRANKQGTIFGPWPKK